MKGFPKAANSNMNSRQVFADKKKVFAVAVWNLFMCLLSALDLFLIGFELENASSFR